MEDQSVKKENAKEEKVGVIPVSEIEGSDADTAYSENDSKTKEEGKQNKDSDSDSHD